MDKIEINIEDMKEWEEDLDAESEAKLKFPVTLKDQPMDGLKEINNVSFSRPLGKKSVGSKTVDISKRSRKNKKEGLF